MFIKILPLSESSSYEVGSNDISAAFGTTVTWEITILDGSEKVLVLHQRSQWNHGVLQPPFVLGGLGRTNNYLEDLTVGYQGFHKNSWTPVIPNSQLMIYRQEDLWKLETLLSNNDRVYSVIYVSIGILILLGIIILIFNYKEGTEDRMEQYNFIRIIR